MQLRPDFVYPTSVGTRDPASHVYKVANSMLQSALKSIQRSAPDGSDCSEAAPDGSDGDELEDIWSPEPVSR